MYRGTTPTIQVNLSNVDFTNVSELWFTISQLGRPIINRDLDEVTIEDTAISVTLTQEETLALRANANTRLQIRILMADGCAMATPAVKLDVNGILKDGVIGEVEVEG